MRAQLDQWVSRTMSRPTQASNGLGPFLALLKQFFKASDRIQEVSLAEEMELILNAITYTRFSPKKGKSYINVVACKRDIILKVINGESISDLTVKYDRTWLWRCKKQLIADGILSEGNDGRLGFPSNKFPSILFIQILKNLCRL